jgi:catechol-2,3-dioxygenase
MYQILVNQKESIQEFLAFIILLHFQGQISLGDLYHRHIAANTWLGTGIDKADSQQPRTRLFSLRVHSRDNFD